MALKDRYAAAVKLEKYRDDRVKKFPYQRGKNMHSLSHDHYCHAKHTSKVITTHFAKSYLYLFVFPFPAFKAH